jgi:hypothetical protein
VPLFQESLSLAMISEVSMSTTWLLRNICIYLQQLLGHEILRAMTNGSSGRVDLMFFIHNNIASKRQSFLDI